MPTSSDASCVTTPLSSSTESDPGSVREPLLNRIGVVGAGVMGAGIAQSLAVAGCPVVLRDISSSVLDQAREQIINGRYGLASAVDRGKLTSAESELAAARIHFDSDPAAFGDLDVVVEAVPEDLALKIAVFRELDAMTAPRTVLASNSSGFPVAALAAATNRPGQVIGWHWASPAPVMRLAEIVRAPKTTQATVDIVCGLAAAAGKNPVVINDLATSWGYVANRIYAAATVEARRIVDEGVATPVQVDQLVKDCFRWPSGPFEMSHGAGSGWSA